MAKQLNPMPPAAKTARRFLWVHAVLALLVSGGLLAARRFKPQWIPELAASHVYYTAIGFAACAVVVVLLTLLMRYQWRWLWLLLLILEIAAVVGLLWCGSAGVNWLIVILLAIVPVIVVMALTGRVTRRWFHH